MVDISMGKYSQLDLIEDSSITIYERNAEGSSLDGSSSARFKKLASSDAGAGLEELGSDNPLHDCNDRIDMPGDSSHPNGVSVEPSSRREPEMTVKQRLVGWACLFLAIMSGSLIGPMFRYIQNAGIAPVLAASWRCQCMSIFLSILAVLERSCNRANRVAWTAPNPDLNGTILFYVFVAGMGWAGNLLLW